MISSRVSCYTLKAGIATQSGPSVLTFLDPSLSHNPQIVSIILPVGKGKKKQHFCKSRLNTLNIMYFLRLTLQMPFLSKGNLRFSLLNFSYFVCAETRAEHRYFVLNLFFLYVNFWITNPLEICKHIASCLCIGWVHT